MKIKFSVSIVLIVLLLSCKKEESNSTITPKSQSEKDSSIIDSTHETLVNSAEKGINGTSKLWTDFYQKNAKKSQQFVINTSKDTTIICAEKTKIKIKANSFVSAKTGKVIDGNVQISVKEYYSISDIVMANLSTTSDGKLLETGGMIDVTANSNGEQCVLSKGKSIEIGFPTKKIKEDMQLFTGQWKNNAVNWKIDISAEKISTNDSKDIEVKPVFPGGDKALFNIISSSVFYPEDDVAGRVVVAFDIDTKGKAINPKIIKKLHPEIDQQVIKVIQKLPNFTPAQMDGKAVQSNYTITLYFDSESGRNVSQTNTTYNQNFKADFEEKYDSNPIEKATINEISYYYFSSSKLGFINCDRFIETNRSLLIDYAIELDTESETMVTIVFKKYKSIMNRKSTTQMIGFDRVPKNQEITIVALKYYNEKPYLAVKKTTTSDVIETGLVFEPVTMDKLKAEMNKLN